MSSDIVLAKQKLPDCVSEKDLTPFTAEPKVLKNGHELGKLIKSIYDKEAKRLDLSPERYEYSNINELYKPTHPIWESHYFLFDAGDPITRGLLGNFLGGKLKESGAGDLGEIFEQVGFQFCEVLYKMDGVDVGSYAPFHEFCNVLNPHMKEYNLFFAYMRHYGAASFRHGFDDKVGLIEGVVCPGMGDLTAGDIDMEPVDEIIEDKLYEVEVKGGKLYMAPIASCNWNFNGLEGLEKDEIDELEDWEIPMKDRMVDTFHWLNGVTPHYMKEQLTSGMYTIRKHNKID